MITSVEWQEFAGKLFTFEGCRNLHITTVLQNSTSFKGKLFTVASYPQYYSTT
jgi:hypothetical protein